MLLLGRSRDYVQIDTSLITTVSFALPKLSTGVQKAGGWKYPCLGVTTTSGGGMTAH